MYILTPSKKANKKFDVVGPNFNLSFGDSRYSDYTKHRDDDRKNNYLSRHQNEDWDDLTKAGTWARFILWNKTTINQSIKDMERQFGIRISTI